MKVPFRKRQLPIIMMTMLLTGSLLGGCSAAVSLSSLSDEFNNTSTLSRWKTATDITAKGPFVEHIDIHNTVPGHLFAKPSAGTWYGENTGHFSYKPVKGDFIVTMKVRVNGKQSPLPTGQYDLSGLLVRVPSTDPSKPVPANRENWEYITTGSADKKRIVDMKTNINSQFKFEVKEVTTEWIELAIIRADNHIVKLYREDGGDWKIGAQVKRADFPDQLQVGFNLMTNLEGPADSLVAIDYVRFYHLKLNKQAKKQLETNQTLDEAQLLQLLGENI